MGVVGASASSWQTDTQAKLSAAASSALPNSPLPLSPSGVSGFANGEGSGAPGDLSSSHSVSGNAFSAAARQRVLTERELMAAALFGGMNGEGGAEGLRVSEEESASARREAFACSTARAASAPSAASVSAPVSAPAPLSSSPAKSAPAVDLLGLDLDDAGGGEEAQSAPPPSQKPACLSGLAVDVLSLSLEEEGGRQQTQPPLRPLVITTNAVRLSSAFSEAAAPSGVGFFADVRKESAFWVFHRWGRPGLRRLRSPSPFLEFRRTRPLRRCWENALPWVLRTAFLPCTSSL